MKFKIFTIGLAVALLGGCVSNAILIGNEPSEPAPVLSFLGAQDAKKNDYLTWENVSSFGRVPAELKAAGDISCMKTGIEMRAVGYHPHAKGRDGKEISGGGYFCQPQVLVGYDTKPPQLKNIHGKVTWDQPSAFGAIPEEMTRRAVAECALINPNSRPLGYHPSPLGVDGQEIAKGGFLCVE